MWFLLAVKYGNEIIESKIENKGFEYPYVIKSCSGHGGSQVFLVNNSKEEEQAIKVMNGQNMLCDSAVLILVVMLGYT